MLRRRPLPSEVKDFKWSDVDWENSRFAARQKKLERHPGRSVRVVPIFVELRPHLERAFREREEDAVHILPLVRITSNVGTHAKRLVKKAGVTLWPQLFVNMRGSCSDDLGRRGVSEKAINAWIGNTGRIRPRRYHAVRPEDWVAVTRKSGAHSGARSDRHRPSGAVNPACSPRKIAGRAEGG